MRRTYKYVGMTKDEAQRSRWTFYEVVRSKIFRARYFPPGRLAERGFEQSKYLLQAKGVFQQLSFLISTDLDKLLNEERRLMGMGITRRDFLKASGVTMGIMICPSFLKDAKAKNYARKLKLKEGEEKTTICPYCGVGCGIIVTANAGKVINTEGDPDHPINEGSLCSKGNSLYQLAGDNNSQRLTNVLWRPPRGKKWIEIPWFLALIMMARKIKSTRDKNFTKNDSEGRKVNRTDAIACLGGADLDNEECYLYAKLVRALGMVYVEHCARI